MQRVQDRRKERETYILSTMKNFFFSYWLCPYMYKLRKWLLPLVTHLITWTRLIPHEQTRLTQQPIIITGLISHRNFLPLYNNIVPLDSFFHLSIYLCLPSNQVFLLTKRFPHTLPCYETIRTHKQKGCNVYKHTSYYGNQSQPLLISIIKEIHKFVCVCYAQNLHAIHFCLHSQGSLAYL